MVLRWSRASALALRGYSRGAAPARSSPNWSSWRHWTTGDLGDPIAKSACLLPVCCPSGHCCDYNAMKRAQVIYLQGISNPLTRRPHHGTRAPPGGPGPPSLAIKSRRGGVFCAGKACFPSMVPSPSIQPFKTGPICKRTQIFSPAGKFGPGDKPF